MNRRQSIQLAGVSIALLSGCASTSSVVPARTTPTSVSLSPLASVTMLSVANADYYVLDNRDIETQSAISNGSDDKRLSDVYVDRTAVDLFHLKMSEFQLTIHEKFDQALQSRLQQAGLSMKGYSAADEAIAVRANGDLATLGDGTDAVVDVRIRSLGYRPISSAIAMTPEAAVSLKVVRVSDSANLGSKRYSFDWRESEGNTRHYRCNENDLFGSVDKLMANLPKAVTILERGTMQMVDRVADDIVQIYGGNALT